MGVIRFTRRRWSRSRNSRRVCVVREDLEAREIRWMGWDRWMDTKYMAYTIDMGNTTGEIPRQAGKQKKDFQVTHLSDRHSVKRASHMMV
jgi:hypothetical protein